MTSKQNDVQPLLTTSTAEPHANIKNNKSKKIFAFIATSLILVAIALLIYFVVFTDDESTDTISCNCNQNGFIQLDSNSCVLPLPDGTAPGSYQLANDIFNATGFAVRDYINITDPNGLPWVIFDEDLQRYIWRYKWDFSAFLLLTNDEDGELVQILIDAAVGIISPSVMFANASALYPMLLERNCQNIDIVIGTHMHADHTGWFIKYDDELDINQSDIIPSFPDARYIISSSEFSYWEQQIESVQESVRFDERYPPIIDEDQLELRDEGNYFVTPKVEVRNCSGHTAGHQCILFHGDTNNQTYIFWGDLIHREIQVSKPEIYPPFDVDPIQAMDRRIEMINFIHDNEMIVFPAHFNHHIIPGKIVECDTCSAPNNLTWMSLN